MKTKIFIIIIILILCNLSPCLTAGSSRKSDTITSDENITNQNIPIPSFHQYIDCTYDHNIVENASYIPGGPPVYIPFNISYWTDIPEYLLKIPFKHLMNLFLFGKFSRIQTINLEVLNEPDWAVIIFNNSNLSFEIDTDKQFAYSYSRCTIPFRVMGL